MIHWDPGNPAGKNVKIFLISCFIGTPHDPFIVLNVLKTTPTVSKNFHVACCQDPSGWCSSGSFRTLSLHDSGGFGGDLLHEENVEGKGKVDNKMENMVIWGSLRIYGTRGKLP